MMSAMDSIIRFSNVLGHLEQACEQLVMAVGKLGWRVHWGMDIVRQATFPRGKADASYLKGLI